MKCLFAMWIFSILCFCGCASSQKRPSEAVKAVHNVIDQLENILTKKYHMQAIGTAIAMPRGIVKELGIHFNVRGPLSKEEIRTTLVNATQDFVDYVNADQRIQSFLEHRPFTFKNVDITLFLEGSGGYEIEHPDIGVAGILKGEVRYITVININEMPHYETKEYESYEEALKIVQEQAAKKNSVTTTIPNS